MGEGRVERGWGGKDMVRGRGMDREGLGAGVGRELGEEKVG